MKYLYCFLFFLVSIFLINPNASSQVHRCNHHTSFDHNPLSDSIDVSSYEIHLSVLDFVNRTIEGKTYVTLSSLVNDLDYIALELMDLSIDSVYVDGLYHTDFSHQNQRITIPLSQSIGIGEELVIAVVYHGEPFHEGWGGFHFSGEYAFNLGVGFESIPHNLGKSWFPCVDDFIDRAYYDVHVTTELSKTGVCGGTLISITENPDSTLTWHWSLANHIPTYLASVAVGEYYPVADTFFGAASTIPISIYVKAGDTAQVDGSFEHLKEIAAIFENRFGPYVWERIGYVGTNLGAMEHPTNIAYPNSCIDNTLTYEYLFAHELSHMWFGDNVTCSSAGDMWLNEGWAVFCESMYREDLYGRSSYDQNMQDLVQEVLQFCHTNGRDGDFYALYDIPQEITYGSTVYDKGATVVHSLRGYLGDDLFFDGVRDYLQDYAFSPVSSYDLMNSLNMSSGIDLSDFFNAWVFTPGTPHFSVDSFSVVGKNERNFDVAVYMKQKYRGADFLANSNIVELSFMDSNWNIHTDTVHFSGETGYSLKSIPFEPVEVYCDLNQLLADAVTAEAKHITSIDSYTFDRTYFSMEVESISDSAYILAEHNWVAPDSLKSPVPGLRISDYRYIKLSGIIPENFVATGKFWYNRNTYLDHTLIINEEDSIVILYRKNTAEDWQLIPFTKEGVWSIGKIYVDSIRPGEYTLGMIDTEVYGIENNTMPETADFIAFPNPAKDIIKFQVNDREKIRVKIYNLHGEQLESFNIDSNTGIFNWQASHLSSGTYLLRYVDQTDQVLSQQKIIINK
jgi:hypothetical protein